MSKLDLDIWLTEWRYRLWGVWESLCGNYPTERWRWYERGGKP